jgi:hypothetical protein
VVGFLFGLLARIAELVMCLIVTGVGAVLGWW